ncbi:FMN-dependent NADH-azoreductase [Streptomyces diastatochromogenes]|uniref:FMN dependent NADH:quinone oxidoreductase n=1 Tax=Streptomyces diastatochromogenes TaxID=42236 RepID=A0A233SY69_STRDA|nr:NAD(P)H-dependent oxidoreductase [Streptomyces diastatochromogenes]MCZ0991705.1 NAD(P)H-dependent oxidoreductase [Streptomyces diastatochromogenes]OXZ00575.1 FMN-dependent NADH-azoreductase [Streptomyces diastatochromogenes]
MATLLHLDSALWPESASASRAVTAAFRTAWEQQHPDGTVIYRDLNADPVPHLGTLAASAGYADPTEHSPEQATAFSARLKLIEELETADAVLIGAPMYNLTVPSTLKAWLDQVILMGRNAGVESSPTKGIPAYVVASRGGSYAQGTPREGYEYVQNYLQAVLGDMLGMEVDFIVPELTLAHTVPAMAELIPLAEASKAKAHEDAISKGEAAALNAVA